MRNSYSSFLCALSVLAAVSATHAQTPANVPTEWPADAVAPSTEQLVSAFGDRVLVAKPASGASWRMQYKASGYVWMNLSNGARDDGKWRTEGTKLCHEFRGQFPSGCNEIRMAGERIYLKRTSGEVVELVRE